jgi:hypothetical protein
MAKGGMTRPLPIILRAWRLAVADSLSKDSHGADIPWIPWQKVAVAQRVEPGHGRFESEALARQPHQPPPWHYQQLIDAVRFENECARQVTYLHPGQFVCFHPSPYERKKRETNSLVSLLGRRQAEMGSPFLYSAVSG